MHGTPSVRVLVVSLVARNLNPMPHAKAGEGGTFLTFFIPNTCLFRAGVGWGAPGREVGYAIILFATLEWISSNHLECNNVFGATRAPPVRIQRIDPVCFLSLASFTFLVGVNRSGAFGRILRNLAEKNIFSRYSCCIIFAPDPGSRSDLRSPRRRLLTRSHPHLTMPLVGEE